MAYKNTGEFNVKYPTRRRMANILPVSSKKSPNLQYFKAPPYFLYLAIVQR